MADFVAGWRDVCWSSFAGWCLAGMAACCPHEARGQDGGDIRGTVVAAIQADPPQTAAELLRASRVLLNVGEASLAGDYLQRVNAMSLSAAELRGLHDLLGSASLLELVMDPRVRLASQPLVDRIFAAVQDQVRAPDQLQQRLAEIEQGSLDEYLRALDALRSAAGWGTAAILERLWRDSAGDNAAADRLSAALRELAEQSPAPLLAAAQHSDPRLRKLAWQTLLTVDIERSLLLPALSFAYGSEADPQIRELAERTAAKEFGRLPPRDQWMAMTRAAARTSFGEARTAGEPVVVWYWDAETQRVEAREFFPAAGAYVRGAERAAALVRVQPDHEDHHELYLAGVLGVLQWTSGWQHSWPAGQESRFAEAAPTARVQRSLLLSLEHRWVAPAAAACRLLGRGPVDVGLLSQASPLARALQDPDARVRQAALEAMIDIDPTVTTAVTPLLWREALRTAAAAGRRRAVVMDPNPLRGGQLASLLRETLWDADAFRTVKPALRLLRRSPDIELILIHSDYQQPPWSEIWQQLRFDWRTRQIATVVLYESTSPELNTDPDIAAEAIFFPVPVDAPTLQTLRRQLLRRTGSPTPSPVERLISARHAAEWIQQVRRSPHRYHWYAGLRDQPPERMGSDAARVPSGQTP